MLTLLKSSIGTVFMVLVGGQTVSMDQLSAPHYLLFGGLEMSWRCQTGYLSRAEQLWVAGGLPEG